MKPVLGSIGLCISVAATTLAAPRVHAEATRAAAQSAPDVPESGWYGAPIVAADIVALGVLGLGAFAPDRTTMLTGAAVATLIYVSAGPVVHLSAGENANAATSLGLRLAPLLVGAPIAYFNRNDRDMVGLSAGAAIMAGGAVAAMVVDSALLAWKPVADSAIVAAVVPAYTGDGSSLVLSGVF